MFRFDFTVPSVMILLILLGYYLFGDRLPLRKNRLFFGLVLLEIIVILFDVLSSRADMNYQNYPIVLTACLNMGFFVFFIARIFWFFLYTINTLHRFPQGRSILMFLHSLVFLVSEAVTISSLFTGAVFLVDAGGYHRGPLYNIIYVCFYYYLLVSVVLILLHRKRITRHELITMLSCNGILIVGNIVRMLMPQYLVMNTFCLMALMALYLSFEDPAIYITPSGGFTYYALKEYMEERVKKGNYRILGFAIRNYSDSQAVYGMTQMDQGVSLICDYLKKRYPKLLTFFLRAGYFAVVGKEDMDYEKISEEIDERFRMPWVANETELYLNVAFTQISSASGIESSEQVVESLMLTLFEIGQYQEECHLIDLDHSTVLEREISVKRALERAVEENGVEVFFQPLVDAQTGELIAAEALARLRDEKGNLIPPIEFIGMAEKNGQINRLGEQVLEKVCRYIHEYGMKDPAMQWINVNLSPVQCMNRELSSSFVGILKKYDVPSNYIHLEITEASMIDHDVLLEQMNELWKAGFCFALDDYGSGYSNLTRVKQFPFTNIKLDMEVVQAHCIDPDQILPVFVHVFKEKGFSITAEGIETEEIAREMTRIGCDYLQGYLYSKPVPVSEFLQRYQNAQTDSLR